MSGSLGSGWTLCQRLYRVAMTLLLGLLVPSTVLTAPIPEVVAPGITLEKDRRATVADAGLAFNTSLLRIDLSNPRVQGFEVNPPNEVGGNVSQFAQRHDLTAAWAANFGSETDVCGVFGGGGELWPNTYDDGCVGAVAFGEDKHVEFFAGLDPHLIPEAWMQTLVAGKPGLILENGLPVPFDCANMGSMQGCARHARTGLGLSADGQTLFLLVIDGGTETSSGGTLVDVAQALADAGADRAVNLAGGTRAALYVEGKGLVNAPSAGYEVDTCCQMGVRIAAPNLPELAESSDTESSDAEQEQDAEVDIWAALERPDSKQPESGCNCQRGLPRESNQGHQLGLLILFGLSVIRRRRKLSCKGRPQTDRTCP